MRCQYPAMQPNNTPLQTCCLKSPRDVSRRLKPTFLMTNGALKTKRTGRVAGRGVSDSQRPSAPSLPPPAWWRQHGCSARGLRARLTPDKPVGARGGGVPISAPGRPCRPVVAEMLPCRPRPPRRPAEVSRMELSWLIGSRVTCVHVQPPSGSRRLRVWAEVPVLSQVGAADQAAGTPRRGSRAWGVTKPRASVWVPVLKLLLTLWPQAEGVPLLCPLPPLSDGEPMHVSCRFVVFNNNYYLRSAQSAKGFVYTTSFHRTRDLIIPTSQIRKLRLREKRRGERVCSLPHRAPKGHDSMSGLPGGGDEGATGRGQECEGP